jgi:hypothetical protein
MPRTTIDIPFTYVAKGIARRDRSEKWHIVLDTVPASLPVREAEAWIEIGIGTTIRRMPVVDGRVLDQTSMDILRSQGADRVPTLASDTEKLTDSLASTHTFHADQWDEAPVPSCQPEANGSRLRPDALKTTTTTDRSAKAEAAVEFANRHLTVVDGHLWTSASEPVFEVAYSKATAERRPQISVGGFTSITMPRRRIQNCAIMMEPGCGTLYVRPDELAAIVEAGNLDVVCQVHAYGEGGLVLRNTEAARWLTDSASWSAAGTLSSCLHVLASRPEDWAIAPWQLKLPVLEGAAAAVAFASTNAHRDRLFDCVETLSKAIKLGRPTHVITAWASRFTKDALNGFQTVARILDWKTAPEPEKEYDPRDQAAFDTLAM